MAEVNLRSWPEISQSADGLQLNPTIAVMEQILATMARLESKLDERNRRLGTIIPPPRPEPDPPDGILLYATAQPPPRPDPDPPYGMPSGWPAEADFLNVIPTTAVEVPQLPNSGAGYTRRRPDPPTSCYASTGSSDLSVNVYTAAALPQSDSLHQNPYFPSAYTTREYQYPNPFAGFSHQSAQPDYVGTRQPTSWDPPTSHQSFGFQPHTAPSRQHECWDPSQQQLEPAPPYEVQTYGPPTCWDYRVQQECRVYDQQRRPPICCDPLLSGQPPYTNTDSSYSSSGRYTTLTYGQSPYSSDMLPRNPFPEYQSRQPDHQVTPPPYQHLSSASFWDRSGLHKPQGYLAFDQSFPSVQQGYRAYVPHDERCYGTGESSDSSPEGQRVSACEEIYLPDSPDLSKEEEAFVDNEEESSNNEKIEQMELLGAPCFNIVTSKEWVKHSPPIQGFLKEDHQRKELISKIPYMVIVSNQKLAQELIHKGSHLIFNKRPPLVIFHGNSGGKRSTVRCAFDPGGDISQKQLFSTLFVVTWFPP